MAKILVIDDDPGVRDSVTRILQREGHYVLPAEDGLEGVRLARAHEPDLVITDLIMPDQDGIETIQLLRDEFPALPIVAMSGGGSVEPTGPLADAELLGADGALAKPFSIEELRALIDRFV
jgi:DNA-binding response OmpR family regulator